MFGWISPTSEQRIPGREQTSQCSTAQGKSSYTSIQFIQTSQCSTAQGKSSYISIQLIQTSQCSTAQGKSSYISIQLNFLGRPLLISEKNSFLEFVQEIFFGRKMILEKCFIFILYNTFFHKISLIYCKIFHFQNF